MSFQLDDIFGAYIGISDDIYHSAKSIVHFA